MITKAHRLLAERMEKSHLRMVVNDILLEILALLFTEEEALLVGQMPLLRSPAAKIAKRVNRPVSEVQPLLDGLAQRGLLFSYGEGAQKKYFVLPIMPGIFEVQMCIAPDDEKTRRFAELYQEYYNEAYVNKLVSGPARAFKVVPIQQSVSTQKIGVVPSDLIRETIDRYDAWSLANYCACRRQKELIGAGCDKPKDVCMQFGAAARYVDKIGWGRLVSKAEVMDAVDRAEAAGLVHFTDNIEVANLSCNCCACCCVALASLTQFNLPGLFTNSRYLAAHDPAACKACGKCAKVCPTGALHVYQKKLIFEPWRCIGCGVCVSPCRQNALSLKLRPDTRPVPENYGQLIVDMGNEYMGVQKYVDALAPGYTRFLGNWLQKGMAMFFK